MDRAGSPPLGDEHHGGARSGRPRHRQRLSLLLPIPCSVDKAHVLREICLDLGTSIVVLEIQVDETGRRTHAQEGAGSSRIGRRSICRSYRACHCSEAYHQQMPVATYHATRFLRPSTEPASIGEARLHSAIPTAVFEVHALASKRSEAGAARPGGSPPSRCCVIVSGHHHQPT